MAALFGFPFVSLFRAFWFSLLKIYIALGFYAIFMYMRLHLTFASFSFRLLLYRFLFFRCFLFFSFSLFVFLISAFNFRFLFSSVPLFAVHTDAHLYMYRQHSDTHAHGPLGDTPILFYHVFFIYYYYYYPYFFCFLLITK